MPEQDDNPRPDDAAADLVGRSEPGGSEASTEPGGSEPTTAEPGGSEPTTAEPGGSEPTTAEPGAPEPTDTDRTDAVDPFRIPHATSDDDETDPRPLSRLARRFRVPIGVIVALLGGALAVVFALRPRAGEGTGAVVANVAGVAVWVCVAAVGVAWALAAPRRVVNMCALAGVAAYVVMLVAGI
ncbi:hypothetical protein [Actinotalea caeni]